MSVSHRPLAIALVFGLAPSIVSAQRSDDEWLRECEERGGRDRLERACEVTVQRMASPAGPIRVDPGQNGGVTVEAWTGGDVEVHARIQAKAETEAAAREIARAVRVQANGGIRAEGPGRDRHNDWHVSFVVYVPVNSDLDISTHNGPLSVAGVQGQMTLEAHNGPLSLRDAGGDIRARTRNGPISVVLSGDQWQGAGLDAETSNGPISVTVPESYNAQLETGTTNGVFTSDFPLTVTLQGRLHGPINATLGRGGAPIRLVTTNGPLRIRRG